MFFIQKLINNNLFKNNHIIILWNVLQVISFQNLANPLSTRAYFKGRAYIKIILKNHAKSYLAGRSYYRGNTVIFVIPQVGEISCLPQN